MLPSEHIHLIFQQIMTKFLRLLYADYMNPAFNRNAPGTIIVGTYMVFSAAMCFYTIIVADRDEKLKVVALIPLGFQGISKFHQFTTKAHILRSHVATLDRIYRQCDLQAREAIIMIGWARVFNRVIKGCVVFVLMGFCVFCVVPPFLYFTTGELTLLLPIILPYFEANSTSGFLAQSVFQIILAIGTPVGVLAADLTLFLQILHVCPLSDVLVLKLRRLENQLTDLPHCATHRQTTTYLNNIICMHKEYFLFMKSLADMFYIIMILEITLNSLSMMMMMFVLLQIKWLPLYMFFMGFIIKTLISCALGTISEHYVSASSVGICWY